MGQLCPPGLWPRAAAADPNRELSMLEEHIGGLEVEIESIRTEIKSVVDRLGEATRRYKSGNDSAAGQDMVLLTAEHRHLTAVLAQQQNGMRRARQALHAAQMQRVTAKSRDMSRATLLLLKSAGVGDSQQLYASVAASADLIDDALNDHADESGELATELDLSSELDAALEILKGSGVDTDQVSPGAMAVQNAPSVPVRTPGKEVTVPASGARGRDTGDSHTQHTEPTQDTDTNARRLLAEARFTIG